MAWSAAILAAKASPKMGLSEPAIWLKLSRITRLGIATSQPSQSGDWLSVLPPPPPPPPAPLAPLPSEGGGSSMMPVQPAANDEQSRTIQPTPVVNRADIDVASVMEDSSPLTH